MGSRERPIYNLHNLSLENLKWFVFLAVYRANESFPIGKNLGNCLIVASITMLPRGL